MSRPSDGPDVSSACEVARVPGLAGKTKTATRDTPGISSLTSSKRADQLGRQAGEAGDVAARPSEARGKAILGRIPAGSAHNGNFSGHLPCCQGEEWLPHEDYVDLLTDQLVENLVQLLASRVGADLYGDGLPQYIAVIP